MANNILFRRKIEEHQSKVQEEREWWERRKASIQESFMKELDGEGATKTTGKAPAAPPSVSDKVSDDDAVLVESGGPAVAASGEGGRGGGGGKKKKKGKK
jgi:translocation protein SEC66